MEYDNFIDTIAAFDNLGIDNSLHTWVDKGLAKFGIDRLSIKLKQCNPFLRETEFDHNGN